MAKDITIRVTGQNADGTLNVQQIDGGNPFGSGGSQTTAMVPYNAGTTALQQPPTGYRAKLHGVEVSFASEADFLRADRAVREADEAKNIPQVGGRSGGFESLLRTGADGAEALGAFLSRRNIQRKIEDLNDALDEARVARTDLDRLETKYPDLVPALRKALLAERQATETSLEVLDDQLLAVDIQTGSGVARVAADLMSPDSPLGKGWGAGGATGSGSGFGTALALGGAGLGLGFLMNQDRRTRTRKSER